ncbi:hypothetical protein [Plantibacter sp. VKM Ac-2876]|uniref:hypothetical protein n=1 Tax=Plantibacter sp. VKM Ac-2876 TaxID=2783826 RepID=UPI00188CD0F9|nr:hypothetical protein [Plantibacter sp. VKM Ac-2876]MBF4565417.1 hypothetical protein [Plantibacter sp. VKM Ac-2876]
MFEGNVTHGERLWVKARARIEEFNAVAHAALKVLTTLAKIGSVVLGAALAIQKLLS